MLQKKIDIMAKTVVKKLEPVNDKLSPIWAEEWGKKRVSFATDFFWKFFLPFLCIIGEYMITFVDVKENYIKALGVLTFFMVPVVCAKVYNADYVKRLKAAGNESRAARIFILSEASWVASLLSPFIAFAVACVIGRGENGKYDGFIVVTALHLSFTILYLFLKFCMWFASPTDSPCAAEQDDDMK